MFVSPSVSRSCFGHVLGMGDRNLSSKLEITRFWVLSTWIPTSGLLGHLIFSTYSGVGISAGASVLWPGTESIYGTVITTGLVFLSNSSRLV